MPGSSGAIRAGKAFIELFADPKKMMDGLKTAGTAVKGWAQGLVGSASKVGDLADKLTPLSEQSTKLADSLDIVGHGAQSLSPLARAFAAVTGSAGGAVAALRQSEVAMIGLSLASKAAGYLPLALAALISPAGLAAAAIAGIGVALVKYTDTGKTAFAAVSASLIEFKDEALETFGAITRAIEAGDLTAAWEVVTTTVELLWRKAMVALTTIWTDISGKLIEGFYGVQEVALFAWGEIEKSWIDLTTGMQEAWHNFYQKFVKDSGVMQKVLDGLAATFLGPLGFLAANAAREAGEKGPDKAEAEQRKKQIDKDVAEGGGRIRNEERGALDANREMGEQRLRDAEARLDEARKNRRAALDRAKGLAVPRKAPEAAKTARAGLDQAKVSAVGTFSAAAAGRLGGGGPFQQIADNTAASAKYLKKMSQQTPTIGFS